jgi:hypothetical protein
VPAGTAIRVARELARNSERSGGRTMIIMGAGICHWFHGDVTYRAILALLVLTGAMGRNGGGWAHYVGQEKCRPVTGWAAMAMATDWQRPPRQAIGTGYWYLHTDQWRYDGYRADALASPLARGELAGRHTADLLAQSVRLGWMPGYPQFDRNPLDLAGEADAAGQDVPAYVAGQLAAGELRFAAEDPDAPQNWPRCLTVWRANLLGSSSKGNEYFLKHLLGTHASLRAEQTPADRRPSGAELTALYRLLAVAKYSDRYVIPTAYPGPAPGAGGGPAGGQPEEPGCSLDYDGGPGMYGGGPFGEASGRPVPVSVETFHALRERQTASGIADPQRPGARVNLLNWDGKGVSEGMFPPRPATPDTPQAEAGAAPAEGERR